jgi:hypothetical protein
MRQTTAALSILLFLIPSAFAASLPESCTLFNGQQVANDRALPLSQYQVKFRSCSLSGQSWIGLRQFISRGKIYALLTNPQNLQTQIADLSCLQCTDIEFTDIPDSPYKKAIKEELSPPFPMSNDGVTRASSGKGLFLTVDLCPSIHPFDYTIYDNPKIKSRNKFPVGISVSGGWIHRHPTEFKWLKDQVLGQHLNTVWINHSYTHPYVKGVPNKDNFLLTPGVNFADEVFKQEQYMISNGITPSVFFRFPGLISSEQLIKNLGQYGLIAVGAEAWLALGQPAKPGSIILIHGNGNEQRGVDLFHDLLKNISNLDVFKSLTEVF